MSELTEEQKEAQVRSEWWQFVMAVGQHGHAVITLCTGYGVFWLLDKLGILTFPPWLVAWIVAFSIVVGAFVSWRKAMEKVKLLNAQISAGMKIPNIAGKWVRDDSGTLTVLQNGSEVSSDFHQGVIDHKSTGSFDPATRKFIVTTKRTNNSTPHRAVTVLRETWCSIDDNRFAYMVDGTDGCGELPADHKESGVVRRYDGA